MKYASTIIEGKTKKNQHNQTSVLTKMNFTHQPTQDFHKMLDIHSFL